MAADIGAAALALRWQAGTTRAIGSDALRIEHRLIVHNPGPGPRSVDAMTDLVPELVDSDGRSVALAGGRNRGAPPAPRIIAAGSSAEFAIAATISRDGNGLEWRGADGLGGHWPGGDFSGRYAIRIRVAGSAGPLLPLAPTPP
jgi:hypothetical protein